MRSLADDFITTVFPGDCRLCARPLVCAAIVPICRACLQDLTPRLHTGCRRCGDRLDLANDLEDLSFRGMECLACRLAPPEFVRVVSFGTYEEALREMIHLLKYERMRPIAQVLGRRLAEAMTSLEEEAGQDLLVVAVPLSERVQRTRGFNQAALLADEALVALKSTHPQWHLQPAHTVLVRQKSTASQYALSRRARRRNLAGAFTVPDEALNQVQGRSIVLVDDVLTTGATARECAKALLRAGALKVWVATVARACGAADQASGHPQRALKDEVVRWDSSSMQSFQSTGDRNA